MEITVKVLGEARGDFGTAERVVSTGEGKDDTARLGTVLAAVCDGSPSPGAARARLFHEDGGIDPAILVMVNGIDHRLVGGLDATVRDGDEITVLPVMHGG